MTYCRKCGAELPEDARFCPRCGVAVQPPEKPRATHQTLKVAEKPKVAVTSTVPGTIDVDTGSEGEVSVDLDLRRPEDLDCTISQDDNTVTVTCRFVEPMFGWPRYIFSGGPRMKIHLSVPEESDLDLENQVGQITVSGVKGNLGCESSTGRVNLRNCSGVVDIRNRVGQVELDKVRGRVSVRNITGSINFMGELSSDRNFFKTTTGSIRVELRGEPDLTIEASSTLGKVRISPDLTESRFERGCHRGQIGTRAGKLIAETELGNVTICR